MKPNVPLLSDVPVSDVPDTPIASEFVAERDAVVQALRRAIEKAPGGAVFGIFGPFGTGKSSVLALLTHNLEQGVASVRIDARRYEADAFRREFLLEAVEQLERGGVLSDYDPEHELRDLQLEAATPERLRLSWRHMIRNLIGVAIVAVAWLAVGGVLVDTQKAGLSLVAVLPLLAYLATRAEQVVQIQAVSLPDARLDDPVRFAGRFRDLFAAVSAETVIVAVDNLDGSPPDETVEIVRSVSAASRYEFHDPEQQAGKSRGAAWPGRGRSRAPKSTLPRVVFVLAADRDRMNRHLSMNAPSLPGDSDRDKAREARDYAQSVLRGTFHTTFDLMAPGRGEIARLIEQSMKPVVQLATGGSSHGEGDLSASGQRQLEQLVDMACDAMAADPTRLQLFVNNLSLRLDVLRLRAELGLPHGQLDDQVAVVGRLLLIQQEWPQRFEELRRDATALERWQESALGGDDPSELEAEDWPSFSRFLRVSRGVGDRSSASLVRLV